MFFRTSLLLAILSFISFGIKGQMTFTMKDTTVAECDGIHTDSDLKTFPTGHYLANEDYIFSICPGQGATIYYTFTSFHTESLLDTLTFFDGPNILSPRLGQYSGNLNGALPTTIVANSGCLTIQFTSDAVLEFPGWIANWNSTAPLIEPPIVNVSPSALPQCDSNYFEVDFDRNVHCDSVESATMGLLGYNAPGIINVVSLNCNNDSTTKARIWLNNPFESNCEYFLTMNLNIPDICDSVYNFTIRDTFDFVNCELLATLGSTNDSLCFGDCATLDITNIASCNPLTFSWNNGLPNTAGPHNVCPLVTTSYIVTITEANSGQTKTDTITIKVLDTLDKELNITVDNTAENPSCNNRWFRVKLDRPVPCYLLDSMAITITSPSRNYTVTNQTALNCTNGFMDSIRVQISPRFIQNCDYFLEIDLSFTDSCEGPITIIARDTFQITDCPFTLTTNYDDTICSSGCRSVRAFASGCDGYNFLWSNGLPNSAGPFLICPTDDTTFYLQVTEISTNLVLYDTITIDVIDPTINVVAPLCIYDSPITLTSNSPGGTWSGTGITSTLLGTFDPSIAGSGTHLITYNVDVCFDTILIEVTDPNAGIDITLCRSGIPINLNVGSPTGGIWTGINVNSTLGTFNPITYGNFTAYYTVNGCVDSINVFVDTIAFSYSSNTFCSTAPQFNIPHTPTGGNWTGTGIVSGALGTFNPASANNGSNIVIYSYLGCQDSIDMNVVLVNAGPDTNACPSQASINLLGFSPALGVWSGIGVNAVGTFTPNTNPGNWNSNLVYTFNGCTDTLEIEVVQTNVFQDTVYICPSQDSILISSITGLSVEPQYGVWAGTGTQNYAGNYYIYPRILGNGYHSIYYDKNTCQDSVIIAIYPDTLSYTDSTVCSIQAAFKLDSINNMPGAIWIGQGITDSIQGIFDPSLASIGVNVITYGTIGGICDKTISITVYSFASAVITLADTFCFTNQNTTIIGSPASGTWSGTGIYNQTLGIFNPRIAGQGNQQIIYSYGSGVCFTSAEKTVYVRDSLSVNLTTSADTICLGDNVTLTGNGMGGYPNPTYTYAWSHDPTTSNASTFAPTSSGNYILTLSDGCSDPTTDTINVTVLSITPNIYTSPTVCFGDDGFATFDQTQKAIYTFNWTNPVSTTDTVFGPGNTRFDLRVSNSFGCFIDTFLIVPGFGQLIADFSLSPDTYPKCLSSNDKKLIVTDLSTGGTGGFWDFGDGTTIPYNPANISEQHTYTTGGNFTVTFFVQNGGACFDTLTQNICVSEQTFFIADIFSPNGDGINDIMFVRSSEAESVEFLIFDRWGKVVFESNDVNYGWDGNFKGKPAEAGVYFYVMKMTLVSGEKIVDKGDITLTR